MQASRAGSFLITAAAGRGVDADLHAHGHDLVEDLPAPLGLLPLEVHLALVGLTQVTHLAPYPAQVGRVDQSHREQVPAVAERLVHERVHTHPPHPPRGRSGWRAVARRRCRSPAGRSPREHAARQRNAGTSGSPCPACSNDACGHGPAPSCAGAPTDKGDELRIGQDPLRLPTIGPTAGLGCVRCVRQAPVRSVRWVPQVRSVRSVRSARSGKAA